MEAIVKIYLLIFGRYFKTVLVVADGSSPLTPTLQGFYIASRGTLLEEIPGLNFNAGKLNRQVICPASRF